MVLQLSRTRRKRRSWCSRIAIRRDVRTCSLLSSSSIAIWSRRGWQDRMMHSRNAVEESWRRGRRRELAGARMSRLREALVLWSWRRRRRRRGAHNLCICRYRTILLLMWVYS